MSTIERTAPPIPATSITLVGSFLETARDLVYGWLLEPARDGDTDALPLRDALAVVERLGFPGTPTRPVEVTDEDSRLLVHAIGRELEMIGIELKDLAHAGACVFGEALVDDQLMPVVALALALEPPEHLPGANASARPAAEPEQRDAAIEEAWRRMPSDIGSASRRAAAA